MTAVMIGIGCWVALVLLLWNATRNANHKPTPRMPPTRPTLPGGGFPDGWEYDPGDPDVGIFGDAVLHEACELPESDICVSEAIRVRYEGEGLNHMRITTWRHICPCGSAIVTEGREWDPYEVEA